VGADGEEKIKKTGNPAGMEQNPELKVNEKLE